MSDKEVLKHMESEIHVNVSCIRLQDGNDNAPSFDIRYPSELKNQDIQEETTTDLPCVPKNKKRNH